jgi:hypothetical protein
MGTPFYANSKRPITNVALDIALEEYLVPLLLNDDFKRLIYASNSYALRKRVGANGTQGLNFPFGNYFLRNISKETDHNLYNSDLAINGSNFYKYGGYVYPLAVTFEYEMTFFFENHKDAVECLNRLLWKGATPAHVFPVVEVKVSDDTSFNLEYPAIIKFQPQLNPTYTEMDWFEKNKVHTVGCDFTVQSFILDSKFGFSIPETILFNFSSTRLNGTTDVEEIMTGIINRFDESVDFS